MESIPPSVVRGAFPCNGKCSQTKGAREYVEEMVHIRYTPASNDKYTRNNKSQRARPSYPASGMYTAYSGLG